MSIIFSLLSKFALSKVKDYIKNNKKEFILFVVVLVCFCIISFMSLRLLYRKNQVSKLEDDIDNLEIKVEHLETTNEYLSFEILNFSNKAFVKNSFTNTTTKIIMITNDFYLIEEDIILRENYKYDFYKD